MKKDFFPEKPDNNPKIYAYTENTPEYKDLIKNYDIFGAHCLGTPTLPTDPGISPVDSCEDVLPGDDPPTTYQTNCGTNGCSYIPPATGQFSCAPGADGDWKNTAPPNYDCTGISFSEEGCYLFNKII